MTTRTRYSLGRYRRYSADGSYVTDKVPMRRYTTYRARNSSDVRPYVTVEGDTLHSIARVMYGDASLWWVISDYNALLPMSFTLPIGTEVLVPKLALSGLVRSKL